MPLSTGRTGRGVKVWVSDMATPTPAWAYVANATTANFTGRAADEIDFTHQNSDGGYREFRQGFKDAGTIECEIHFDPSHPTHENLETLLTSGAVIDLEFDMTDAGYTASKACFKVKGYVASLDINTGIDDPTGGSVSFRLTGAGVWGTRHA